MEADFNVHREHHTFWQMVLLPSVMEPLSSITPSLVEKVMSLYPDIPNAGSPFATENETFSTGSGYKRQAAICMS